MLFRKVMTLKSKVSQVLSNPISSIVSDSIQVFIMRIFVVAIGLTGNVLVARHFGPETLGLLALINSILVMICIPSLLGLNVSVLRIIPEAEKTGGKNSVVRVFYKMVIIVCTVGICIISLLFVLDKFVFLNLFDDMIEPLTVYIFIAAIFKALIILITQYSRALKQIKKFLALNIIPPIILLAGYLLGVVTNTTSDTIIKIYFASIYISFAIILMGVIKDVVDFSGIDRSRSPHGFKTIIHLSFPMMITIVATSLAEQYSILYMSSFVSLEEIGIYSAALKLSMLIGLSLKSVNTVIATKVADFHLEKRYEDMIQVSRAMSKVTFWCTLPLIIVLCIYGGEILIFVYGPLYSDAYEVLVVLVAAQFINTISGCTGIFLNMSGYQRAFRNIMLLNAVVYILLCTLLIPKYGIMGAAYAFCVAELLWNFMSLLFIKAKFGSSIHYLPKFLRN